MAFTVPQQWTGSGGRDDLPIPVQPTAGNWMIVTVAYRATDGTDPLASIADLARNWWLLLGQARNATSGIRVEVWACPAVDYAAFPLDIVYAAVSHIHADDVGSVVVNVAEVNGFANNFPTVVSVTASTATATSFGLTMPAPGQAVFAVGVAATDNAAAAVTAPGSGWAALTQVSRPSPDVRISPAWLATSATSTATWTTTPSLHWAGVVVAIAATGTVWPQPNPNWPATKLQLARTVGQETPLPRAVWTDLTSRWESLQAQRGVQYELGRTQAGEATIVLSNFDDAVTPQAGGAYDIYTPYQLLAAWGGKVYPVSSGYVEEWPRRWTDPHHGYIDAAGVDAVATLVQDVPTPIQGEVLRHAPWAYWPLTDPGGSTNAINISDRSSTLLNLQRSKYGVANATADFGSATDIDGDPGSGWQQQGLVPADSKRGYALVGTDPAFPPISGGITIVGLMRMTADLIQPTGTVTLALLRSADSRNSTVIKFAVETALFAPQITVWDKDTAAASTTTGLYNMAQNRMIPFVLRFNRTSFRAEHTTVGGAGVMSGSCDLPDSFNELSFGGEADAYWNGNCGNVTLGHLAIYDRWITDDEADQYVTQALIGWRGYENAATRIQRFLAIAGAYTPRALDQATSTVSADSDTGTVAERSADYADQDGGLLFGDAAGYLRLRSQSRTYRQSVRWTLGDDTAAGEIPFEADAMPTMGPTYLMTTVTVTNQGEQSFAPDEFSPITYPSVAHTAVDVAQMSRYGPRPMERSTHYLYASAGFGLSQWLLAQYKAPRARFETVTVSAATFPAAWPLVLGVEVGDLVDVVRRPVGQAAVRVSCRVMQVRHTITAGRGQTRGEVTLTLAAAFPPVLVLGHPTKAVLGNNTIGWA